MTKQFQCPELILASNSPRRRSLLEQAGLEFSVIPSDIDEDAVAMSSPDAYTRKLAECKAMDISDRYPDSWVIGADTIVVIDDIVLGKPGSGEDARRMLKKLSGQTHQVITGYCVCCKNKNRFFSDIVKTDVMFRDLSDEEIEWYIDTGEPFDKAGAYAIQGMGVLLVKRINGSYTNVVGLPVCEVVELLIKERVRVFDNG